MHKYSHAFKFYPSIPDDESFFVESDKGSYYFSALRALSKELVTMTQDTLSLFMSLNAEC